MASDMSGPSVDIRGATERYLHDCGRKARDGSEARARDRSSGVAAGGEEEAKTRGWVVWRFSAR